MLSKIAKKNKLTLGLVFPIEGYSGSIAKMENQEKLAKRAEELGFKALWFRDVPFNDPTFGDAGQLYDTWVYIAHIMNHTKEIALATGSIILPLRHPAHSMKAINSIQKLSKGRLIVGVASGDRLIEYAAFNKNVETRAELFRDSFFYMKALQDDFPNYESNHYGNTNGTIDLLPKHKHKTSFLVTGHSGQALDWIAKHADGWLYYPRNFNFIKHYLEDWSKALEKSQQPWKPYMQSLYLDIQEKEFEEIKGIHLGFKLNANNALEYLKTIESIGVNHVIVNLKYSTRPVDVVLEEIGEFILPHFT